jgi:hypothetical protein
MIFYYVWTLQFIVILTLSIHLFNKTYFKPHEKTIL